MFHWIFLMIILATFTFVVVLWVNDHGDTREETLLIDQQYQP